MKYTEQVAYFLGRLEALDLADPAQVREFQGELQQLTSEELMALLVLNPHQIRRFHLEYLRMMYPKEVP